MPTLENLQHNAAAVDRIPRDMSEARELYLPITIMQSEMTRLLGTPSNTFRWLNVQALDCAGLQDGDNNRVLGWP